jgi:hypothetical protein
MTSKVKNKMILVLAGLLIAIAAWWFEIEQPAREAAKKAAQEANSQRKYWTQLRLVRHIEQPFRFAFTAYDGNAEKPESLVFQVTAIDVNQPSQFVKIGDIIAGTEFKVAKFEDKLDPRSFGYGDLSRLILLKIDTGETVVLVLNKVTDFPNSYALFRYLGNNTEFPVKKDAQFVLPPKGTDRYRLINVTDSEAIIATPAGQEVNVPHL